MENRRPLFEMTFESDNESSASDVSIDSLSESDSEMQESDQESEIEINEIRERNEESNWILNDRTDKPKREFTGPRPGPTIDFDQDSSEIDFFTAFFPLFMIEHLVGQTNLYARTKQAARPDAKWRPVTFEEMKAWIGLRIYMSILYLPQTAMYWSTDALFGNLSIRRIMKRDRFDKISQYFHANDRRHNPPRGQPGHDKLFLIRPILNEVNERCLQNYNPHQNVSVDEGMVKYRGRLSFKQYLPAKPTKYGIKVWMRADPVNGYTNEFQVYTGKENGAPEIGLASRVVQDMTRRIWGRNHIVNIDNYFTSPALFTTLLENNTYARGTIRSNRKGFPFNQLRPKEIKEQGQFRHLQKGEATACVWKDKRHIFFLSTADNPAQIDREVARKSRTGELNMVPAPSIVLEYNANMNGVDHADQLRTEYSTYRTSRRWWLYLFWFLVDLSITNGFVLLKESAGHLRKTKTGRDKPWTMVEFRMNLAKLLIGDYVENERAALTTIAAGHFPKTSEKRGRCRQCSKQKRRREIRTMCGQCNIHLCPDCFQPWHRDLLKNV